MTGVVVASYNVLADAYARPERSPRTSTAVLAWPARRDALATRMLDLDADVLCLQEVEAEAFAFWAERLGAHGYQGVYAQKRGGKPDGCATFFRPAALTLARADALFYADGSGHLAQLLTFGWAGATLHIANTHLKWAPDHTPAEQHSGWRQCKELIDRRIANRAPGHVWVVCGDFNAPPDSSLVGLLRAHTRDAHADRPQPTCNPNGRAKRIDYIFHAVTVTAQPGPLPVVDDLTPLPSETEPSDHLPITARLSLTVAGGGVQTRMASETTLPMPSHAGG